ncbi:hypothetical protein A4R26_29465 [Niastella populi]|uniref:Uncharacterized protein n=1 Tax=Niastella populi TaxID=550983 RepID=A0A1V9F022_9BACT|nr:hypothetical protein A4R26_29465 [Niastella populi]
MDNWIKRKCRVKLDLQVGFGQNISVKQKASDCTKINSYIGNVLIGLRNPAEECLLYIAYCMELMHQ